MTERSGDSPNAAKEASKNEIAIRRFNTGLNMSVDPLLVKHPWVREVRLRWSILGGFQVVGLVRVPKEEEK